MYKIEILEKINEVKNSMQELEFKALFYSQPMTIESKLQYSIFQVRLTDLNNRLIEINKA